MWRQTPIAIISGSQKVAVARAVHRFASRVEP